MKSEFSLKYHWITVIRYINILFPNTFWNVEHRTVALVGFGSGPGLCEAGKFFS